MGGPSFISIIHGASGRLGALYQRHTYHEDRLAEYSGCMEVKLAVVSIRKTQEVLAVRRGFIRSGWMKNMTGIWWLTGRTCPAPGAKREHLFIKEILRPVTATASSKEK